MICLRFMSFLLCYGSVLACMIIDDRSSCFDAFSFRFMCLFCRFMFILSITLYLIRMWFSSVLIEFKIGDLCVPVDVF